MQDYRALNWHKTYGIKQLLDDVSFIIREGEHIGLIGANGSGKSTMLKIMAELDSLDRGTVECPNDFSIGYVEQAPVLDEDQTIFEAVYNGDSPIIKIVGQYEQATRQLAANPHDDKFQKAFSAAEQAMNAQDGWNLETTIHTILNKLGIHNVDQSIKELSGGQRKRVGLAKVLIESPDLLLLDEPTNHLDFEMVTWLEKFIANYPKSVVVVTHDRYFLDAVATRIYALHKGHLKEYAGNYQAYLEQKAEEDEIAQAVQAKQQKLYKSELAWMRKGAKARTTKQQARIHRFESLEAKVKQKDQSSEFNLNFDQERLGKQVMELTDVAVGYDQDKPLLKDINLLVQNRDRFGIIGENGTGKTTLLNTIAGKLPPLAGTIKLGETVRLAYFQQLPSDLPEDKRVIAYIQEVAEDYTYANGEKVSASQMLERFLFDRIMHGVLIGSLSGGEKKRLYLLKLLMERPNVLFLDEPTNDLDIETLTVLEDYLQTFPGAIITVSHDRYFLDKTVDKLLLIEKGSATLSLFYGNYSEYQTFVKENPQVTATETISESQKTNQNQTEPVGADHDLSAKKPKRMSYQEKKDWATIEAEIEQLENEISTIENEMIENGSDYGRLNDLQKEKESKENDLLEKMAYWEYLEGLA